MLHEVLLALSGHPSPLFDEAFAQDFPLITPAEGALLKLVGHLAHLHKAIRLQTKTILEKHPSVICRSVANTILSKHLSRFQQAIVDVEERILSSDSSTVGAYNIVPLASVVSNFNDWRRRLEWLSELSHWIQPTSPSEMRGERSCSHGSQLINRLRDDSLTGYPDIEALAIDLTKTAETAWLRQLSTWILKGRAGDCSAWDFIISEKTTASGTNHTLPIVNGRCLPEFVTSDIAASILYIGKTLNYVESSSTANEPHSAVASLNNMAVQASSLQARSQYVTHLETLDSPITAIQLSVAVSLMRSNLSRQLVHGLLPTHKLAGTLSLLRQFFLACPADFVDSLIYESDKYMRLRHSQIRATSKSSKGPDLAGVMMRETEVEKVLANTWGALAATLGMHQTTDASLDWARENVRLQMTKPSSNDARQGAGDDSNEFGQRMLPDDHFEDVLLATPINLTLELKPPLDLFLNKTDVKSYTTIFSYLTAIRKSYLHLANMWRNNMLRKGSAFAAGPRSSYQYRMHSSRKLRLRALKREADMKPMWAVMSSAVFFLSELGEHNAEVIGSSWERLRLWLRLSPEGPGGFLEQPFQPFSRSDNLRSDRAKMSGMTKEFSDSIASIADVSNPLALDVNPQHDPELVSEAHRQYLAALVGTLLLPQASYIKALRSMLLRVDQLVAYVTRLQGIQVSLDLQDEGVDDGFADQYAQEHREVHAEMMSAGQRLAASQLAVTEQLRVAQTASRMLYQTDARTGFQPWNDGGIDRLLMRLDLRRVDQHG